MATAVWPIDSIAVLTKPLDAPEASCLYREVHQDDFRVTEASPFLSLAVGCCLSLVPAFSFCMVLFLLHIFAGAAC